MKRHRHTPEQAVRKVGEGERLLNDGKDLAEILRTLEISEAALTAALAVAEAMVGALGAADDHPGTAEPPGNPGRFGRLGAFRGR